MVTKLDLQFCAQLIIFALQSNFKTMEKLTELLTAYNCDNLELLAQTGDNTVDVVCIDPPYLYLKNQKLERPFDASRFFGECKRVLKPSGFIVMFGRGVTFYKWCAMLDDLGFIFKEEIIWDKVSVSSPLHPLLRQHELVAVFAKTGLSKISPSRVPYILKKEVDFESIAQDIRVITSALKTNMDDLDRFIKSGQVDYNKDASLGYRTSGQNRKSCPRPVSTLNSILGGMRETTIIREGRGRTDSKGAHPTQKPTRLIERLLAIVAPQNVNPNAVVVADYFGGSFSTLRACFDAGYTGVACEIDTEYYSKGVEATKKYIELKVNEFLKDF